MAAATVPRMHRAAGVGALTLAWATVAACATLPPVAPTWPGPPAKPRIRYLRSIGSGADVESGWVTAWRRISGSGAPHHLYHPVGIAVSPDGRRLFVSDQALGELFAFDTARGTVRVVTQDVIRGTPVGVAADEEGDAWLVVPERRTLLRFGPDLALRGAIELEGADRPTGLAVDRPRDRIYVADTSRTDGPGHSIRVYDLAGKPIMTIGSRGSAPGQLLFPTFVAVRAGEIYVADTLNARVQRFDPSGNHLGTIGERGDRIGQFDKPKGLAFDAFGNLYVVDSFWSNVQIFNQRGQVLLFFGGRGDSLGFLSNPAGIAIDRDNRIYVTNPLNFRVDVYELFNTRAEDSEAGEASAPSPEPARPAAVESAAGGGHS